MCKEFNYSRHLIVKKILKVFLIFSEEILLVTGDSERWSHTFNIKLQIIFQLTNLTQSAI